MRSARRVTLSNMVDSANSLRLFISYSRRDLAFVERLLDVLKARGFQVRMDLRDLPKLEDWQRELLELIRQADTVVFIVSQHSLTSPVVAWEIDQVRLHGKRLAPVVIGDVAGLQIPSEISRINYVYFTDQNRFDQNTDELVGALNTDIVWLKEHTRLGDLASRWSNLGQLEDALIRGMELGQAEVWLGRRPRNGPPVTSSQKAFLDASRLSETARVVREAQQLRRRRQMQLAVALLLVGTFGYSGWTNRPYVRARLADLKEFWEKKVLDPATERAFKPMDAFSECTGC